MWGEPLGLFGMVYYSFIMPDRDEETGLYTGEYDQDDFLVAIRESEGPAGTGEIADSVGCSHDTAYKRLKTLEEEGIIVSQKVGNTLVWSTV